jgi:hypothetical protein
MKKTRSKKSRDTVPLNYLDTACNNIKYSMSMLPKFSEFPDFDNFSISFFFHAGFLLYGSYVLVPAHCLVAAKKLLSVQGCQDFLKKL